MKSILVAQPTITKKAIRFGCSGVLVTTCHILIATAMIEFFLFSPPIANGVAFVIATYLSYVMNTKWSFSREPNSKILLRFCTVSLFGLALAMSLSHAIAVLELHYAYGIMSIICIMPIVNFLLHHFWTYR